MTIRSDQLLVSVPVFPKDELPGFNTRSMAGMHGAERDPMKLLSTKRRGLSVLATAAALYVGLAYVVLPALWTHHEQNRGSLRCRW